MDREIEDYKTSTEFAIARGIGSGSWVFFITMLVFDILNEDVDFGWALVVPFLVSIAVSTALFTIYRIRRNKR